MKLRQEQTLIALLSLVAALRVFLFAAAFPFFSNGDEDLHFDLIVRYSAGHAPRNFDRLSNETLEFITIYASPEFLQSPDNFQDGKFPTPLWKQPTAEAQPVIEVTREAWANEINWEASQPPLYYSVAGFWWKAGRAVGLSGIESLYWIRFLNTVLIAALVWIGFLCARMLAPECPAVRIGAPMLLAMMPQDVFYVMSNDVLSPICFGLLFLCLLRCFSKPPSFLLGAITGLAIAATYLTKLSNLPLVAVAFLAIVAVSFLPNRRPSATSIGALIIIMICAAVPIAAWMIWSRANFGDVTGSAGKMALLDWTMKPVADWWHHPIFSLQGVWVFWSEMLSRFWRGELMWHNQELAAPLADKFYSVSSFIALAAALFGIGSRTRFSTVPSSGLLFAALAFFSSLVFFVLLSIQFDFGRCVFPSQSHPYFTSGRLMSGVLVPFTILYAYGVGDLLHRIAPRFPPWIVFALIAVSASVSEIAVKHSVFASEHNWFHL